MNDARDRPDTLGRPLTDPLRPAARPWQRHPATQLLAVAAAVTPMIAISVWTYLLREGPMTLKLMLLGPLLGGGTLIFWLLFLQLFVCGDSLDALGFRARRPAVDVALGVALSAGLLAFHFAFNATIAPLFPRRPPPEGIVGLLRGLANNLWLVALWLGPVVWIGVALFEELTRAFLLRRGWRLASGPVGRWVVILFVSALVGVAHGYQGPAAILSIGTQSVAKGWIYMATGRIRALIVAHALYDSVQVVLAVIALRG